jgi:hypothetical protein
MTHTPARRRKTFATSVQAIDYLEAVGFTFMGAPDRWRQFAETRTAYARIIATPSAFQIRFAPSKTT